MRIHWRQRGQGATEYILILALAIIVILGLMYVFRDTIGGTTSQISDAVSGKQAQAAVPTGDNATKSASAQEVGSSAEGESGGEESSKGKSAVEANEEPEDEQASVETSEDRASSGPGVVENAPRTGSHRVMIIVLVAIAGVLVLVVLYFLGASR